MFWFYVATAIFGWAFVLPMLFGGLDLDSELDADFDGGFGGDLELDGGIDAGGVGDFDSDLGSGLDVGDADGLLGGVGDFVGSLLNFRSLLFFSAFFGTAGVVFSTIVGGEAAGIGTILTAVFLGLVAAVVNGQLTRFIKTSEASSQITDREIRGRTAQVVVPLGPGTKGRIKANFGGQPQYLIARPHDSEPDAEFKVGDQVVVVEVENGTALVASLHGLELEEEM